MWTINVEKALVYAAFAQAYPPALPQAPVSVASVGSEPHQSESQEYKPTCGVSLAVVAKASLLDQQGQYAGTAHLTDELIWCPVVHGKVEQAGLQPSCLPNSNIQQVPAPTVDKPVVVAPPLPMATVTGAWQAKLAAVATQQLRQQLRREPARMPYIGDTDQEVVSNNNCNNPGVGFANPGALKVTLDLIANKQYRSGTLG